MYLIEDKILILIILINFIMKSFLYTCLILFNVFQCQIKPMYKNLICAGGWYELEDLKIYPNLIPTESDFSPIRIFIDYTKFDSQCENDNSLNDICSFQDVIKQQLTKAGNLIEQIINVKRFSQNLIFNDDFMKQNLGVLDYDQNLNNGIPYDYVILLKIENHTEVSKKILGEPDELLKIRIENEKNLYSFGIEDYKNNIKNEQVLSKEFSRIINNYLKRFFTIKQINKLNEIVQRN